MICYMCGNELTKENETEEHIILNSLGGKLKSKKLICKGCNSDSGSRIDDKLSNQLGPIATLLNVKRDRGKLQNIKGTSGTKDVLLEPGGKMKLSRTYCEIEDKVFQIEAPSVGAAKKVLLGLKNRYPQIDIERTLGKAESTRDKRIKATFKMDFGGKDIARAFCKMAMSFFVYHGGDSKVIRYLLPFIKGTEQEAEVYFFYPRSEVFYKQDKEVLHTIILRGDKTRKQLYTFIELFNEFKMVVFLNRAYQGEELYESHHYNVVTNKVIVYENRFTITPKELKSSCSKELDETTFLKRMTYLFQQIRNIDVSRKIHSITNSSMEELIKEYPLEDNEYFTDEMIRMYTEIVLEKYFKIFQD